MFYHRCMKIEFPTFSSPVVILIAEVLTESSEEVLIFSDSDLFVGGGVGESDALDLRAGVSSRTGTTAETRGGVYAAHTHVTRLHDTLPTTTTTQKQTTRQIQIL